MHFFWFHVAFLTPDHLIFNCSGGTVKPFLIASKCDHHPHTGTSWQLPTLQLQNMDLYPKVENPVGNGINLLKADHENKLKKENPDKLWKKFMKMIEFAIMKMSYKPPISSPLLGKLLTTLSTKVSLCELAGDSGVAELLAWSMKHRARLGCFFFGLGSYIQLMANCWSGARWFGIWRVPLRNNPFNRGIPGIQTTGPKPTINY